MKSNKFVLTVLSVFFVFVFTSGVLAQNSSQKLTLETVLKMHESGVSPDNIVTMITLSPNKEFNLTPEDVILLTQKKVDKSVIGAMMAVSGSSGGSGSAPAPEEALVAANPNDPAAVHDSGIYLHVMNRAGQPEMVMLEPALATGTKEGGGIGSGLLKAVNPVSGLISQKIRAEISGKRANIITTDSNPVFYFYFENTSVALGKTNVFSGITSPNQVVLVKLKTKDKTRETVVGKSGIGGSSVGIDQKATVPFRSERLRPGAYKVTLQEELKDGEYAFLIPSSATGSTEFGAVPVPAQIFDFSVPKER